MQLKPIDSFSNLYDYDLGVMYRVGEFVVVQDSLSEGREWIMEISSSLFMVLLGMNTEHL